MPHGAGPRIGDEERRLMHLVPAPAVRLMKRRVLSRPGLKSLMLAWLGRDGPPKALQRERKWERHTGRKEVVSVGKSSVFFMVFSVMRFPDD